VDVRTRLLMVAVVAAVLGFGAGAVLGASGTFGMRVPTSVGDAIVGGRVVTISANGTAYGAKDSVAWRDTSGSFHPDGWPACLSTPGEVKGVRFAGTTVWNADLGADTVLWVDCQHTR
jgi:hypothetical protein